ncbi:sodium/potassium-transporting ATPase subunit beta-2-like [Babylonia areolata]|uniref:sodium/potassium-transporting ATPase subunit beta-2-like n=1 Tax=Babylonia areolata TaxID=304850 RepID=UPI003FD41F2B
MASMVSISNSALYQSTSGGSSLTRVYRESLEDRIQQWRTWLLGTDYDGKRLCMGRSLLDWLLLIGCYTAVLGALVILFVVFMALFYWIVDWNYPTLQGPAAILQTPGIGFRPQPDLQSNVVRFVKGDVATYRHHLDQLEAYLKYYENQNQQGENYIDCNEIHTRRTEDLNKVCRFDLMDLGQDCVKQQNYGFDNGQPCVLIKLNKVFDWIPEEYTEDTVPEAIKDQWSQWWVTVTCDGETAFDRENQGDITIWPHEGFHFKYFPFRNQQGYRSPLVFVRFEDPRPGILLMMTCKAWARNIVQDSNEMIGQVHFELMVD